MKKWVFIFTILVGAILITKAQPNPGFENWTTSFGIQDPDHWQTLNFFAIDTSNPLSALKATGIDKHSGNYALKLRTVYIQNNPYASVIGDTTGGVFTGKFTYSPFAYKYGFPYTGRPQKLEFWSKYYPVGSDTAGAVIILKKWNGSATDTIAIGSTDINATAGYTPFTIDLVYYSNELPDSAVIGFTPSKLRETSRINSTLYVDDVSLTGWVGINKYDKSDKLVKVLPNPARDNLTIFAQIDGASNVNIFDALGKSVGIYKMENSKANIYSSSFPEGIYFYEIRGKKDEIFARGKFNVIK